MRTEEEAGACPQGRLHPQEPDVAGRAPTCPWGPRAHGLGPPVSHCWLQTETT